jgi:putative tRNA adenosine deaminase-associated protein
MGVFVTLQGWHIARIARRQAWCRLLVKLRHLGLPLAHMGAQSAPAQGQAADMPDGFGIAVVREDGKWRCSAMRRAALNSLAAAETELRELRSAGAVFGLLDVDDEFFVIVRPAPAGTRLLLSDATAALDYDIAAEVLEKLDNDISPEELEEAEPFEEGDLGLLADVGLPEAVLGVILDESDLYADEQLGRIAREMGFADELSAVLDRLDR